eukprot:360699_1
MAFSTFIVITSIILFYRVSRIDATCQAIYMEGMATTPLNVCQSNSGTSSSKYICVAGTGYWYFYFNGDQCAPDNINPISSAVTTGTAQCTGSVCDYVTIRYYTTDGCHASSSYGDFAIVTNECVDTPSNPDYKSWMNYCTDSSYGSIQFVGTGCVGQVYDHAEAYSDGYCDPASNTRIDIVTCTNPISLPPPSSKTTDHPTTIPPSLHPTFAPTTNPTIQSTTNPTKQPSLHQVATLNQTEHPTSSPTMDCAPSMELGCKWYLKCLESKFECGDDGYPSGYGYYFCNRYGNAIDEFSYLGKLWVNQVQICLQNELRPLLQDKGNPSSQKCDHIKSIAYDSHSKCYLGGNINSNLQRISICDIIEKDWDVIFQTVYSGVLNLEGICQMYEIASECANDYISLFNIVFDNNYGFWRKMLFDLRISVAEFGWKLGGRIKKFLRTKALYECFDDIGRVYIGTKCDSAIYEVAEVLLGDMIKMEQICSFTEGSIIVGFSTYSNLINNSNIIKNALLDSINQPDLYNFNASDFGITKDRFNFSLKFQNIISVTAEISTTYEPNSTATTSADMIETTSTNFDMITSDEKNISVIMIVVIAVCVIIGCFIIVFVIWKMSVCTKKKQYHGVNSTTNGIELEDV